VCTSQQSDKWLLRAIGNQRLGSGVSLKATDARNILKHIMVALRMKEEVAKHPVELLQGIKDPSEGFI
jgi:hypothetical protein